MKKEEEKQKEAPQTAQAQQQSLVVQRKETFTKVLDKINELKTIGEIVLPADYSPENALKSAYLLLNEMTVGANDNKKPLLAVVKSDSIANALLDMVVQGLSPLKKQCYFIPYGDKLTLQRSYLGSVAVAKRVGGLKAITANIIYKDDIFKYEINSETGYPRIVKHEQEIENIDESKIRGAYCTVHLNDGTTYCDIMPLSQIEVSWKQGSMGGNSPAHKKFTGEMAKKTVINRACKMLINTSSDSTIYEEKENDDLPIKAPSQAAPIEDEPQRFSFDDHEEINSVTKTEQQQEKPLTELTKEEGPGF